MVKLNKLLLSLIMLLAVGVASAQDIHFSQFNQAPLALNPALTGNYACDWRAGLNYRNQWSSVTTPYKTYSVYADMPFKTLGNGDRIAAGLLLFNDVSGDGNLSVLSVMASGAYHKSLSGGNSSLSGGLQLGYVQKSINWEKLQWGTQFDGSNFDPSLPSYEPFNTDNFGRLDVNLGLVFKGQLAPKFLLEVGSAVHHVVPPKESFLNDADNKLGTRITGHARAIVNLTNTWAVIPTALYMTQSGAHEIAVGADLGYYLANPSFPATFYLGGYYRLDDAIIASMGIDYKNFRLGVSYDVNTSSLKDASSGKGGLELSLSYTGCILPVIPTKYELPCIRFNQ